MHHKPSPILPIMGTLIAAILFPGTSFSADIQVSATILLGKGSCSIVSVVPAVFNPALDPLTAPNRTADATVTVNCKGLGNKAGTVVVQRQESSSLFLSHTITPTETIAYSLDLPQTKPVTNNTDLPITITATIMGTDYQNAPAGDYTDTVGIEVLP